MKTKEEIEKKAAGWYRTDSGEYHAFIKGALLMQSQSGEQKGLNLWQCKNEIAKRLGFGGWEEIEHDFAWNKYGRLATDMLAELYLQSNKGWSDEDMVLFAMFNYKRQNKEPQFTTKDNLTEFKNYKEDSLNYLKSKNRKQTTMKTPKEEAEEIVEKFKPLVMYDNAIKDTFAIQAAILHVEGIIEDLNKIRKIIPETHCIESLFKSKTQVLTELKKM